MFIGLRRLVLAFQDGKDIQSFYLTSLTFPAFGSDAHRVTYSDAKYKDAHLRRRHSLQGLI